MKKILIDANVILRYLLNDIEEMAIEAEKIIKFGAFTVPEVIAEVVYVLKSVYKVERREISNAILEILKEIDIEHKNVMIEAVKIFSETNCQYQPPQNVLPVSESKFSTFSLSVPDPLFSLHSETAFHH